jgi:hypothetical protein
MYSDSDLDAAVAAGAIDARSAAAFRHFVEQSRTAPSVDEEQFRLLTGFNDIFVSIATALMLGAIGWLGSAGGSAVAGGAVAATGWALAEYFTRRRRMALPSLLLLLVWACGVFKTAEAVLGADLDRPGPLAAAAAITVPMAAAAPTATVIGTLKRRQWA